jgi:ABC-type amino acid transport system permease subunit
MAGRQGVMRLVIVPQAEARDREAYAREIARICPPQTTCFVNFYTNSTGAPLAVPLPDAVSAEATAVFRRSTKQMAESFRWSCRMGTTDTDCF